MNSEFHSEKCLRSGKGDCRGPIDVRYTDLGTQIFECEKHMDDHYAWADEHRRIYPDSPIAPSWFDPMDAGEVWDESDY